MRKNLIYWIAACGLLYAGPAIGLGQMDTHFSYQGQLLQAGEPVTDLLDMRFSLWNAASGGLQLGTDFTATGVDVVEGLFVAQIDSSYFDPNGFNGDPRWLEIEVYDLSSGWLTLAPRQPMNPTPYALYAAETAGGGGTCVWSENGSNIYYNSGYVGIGTSSPTVPLSTTGNTSTVIYVNNSAGGTTGNGLTADTSATSAAGVVGRNNSSTGNTQGVFGLAYSPEAQGVRGQNGATYGDAVGVYGLSSSIDGIAVYGRALDSSGTGTTIGVMGEIGNSSGTAIYGEATATTGTANGVWATTASTEGSGVFGQNTSTTGSNEGVMGVSWSSFGTGVMGYNGSAASTAIGVLGRTLSGDGVRGEATSTTASTAVGVRGQTNSSSGTGVYGYAPTGGRGVVGYSGTGNYGYVGWSSGGVYGRSTDGYGVRGYSANDWAIYGSVPNGSTEAGVVGAIILDNGGTLWKSNSGVSGGCQDGQGVAGRTIEGVGVFGEQTNSGNIGHLGTSTEGAYGETSNASNYGVHGKTTANYTTSNGVYGEATGATYGIGVRGSASNTSGAGVYGYNGSSGFGGDFYSNSGSAARFTGHDDDCVIIDHDAGITSSAGLVIGTVGSYGEQVGLDVTVDAEFGRLADFDLNGSTGYIGSAFTIAADNSGNVLEVLGEDTTSNYDVVRSQSDGYGSAIYGYNSRTLDDAPGVRGYHISSIANYGIGVKGEGGYKGVEGRALGGDGTGTKYGVYGYATGGTTNYAGYFSGNLRCTGTLSKGSGTFVIDHPLDPENKYLYHSFVESPDMMNIYNGNVVLDERGEAVVTLPEWFEALNREFRYQLTCIGGFAQVYIAEEIRDNQFTIAGGTPGLKVSWQVTGVRQDPFAEAHRVQVEVDKPDDEIGTYLHPDEWGVAPDLQVDRVREARRQAEMDETAID
jgi:hypothetical protein